MRHSSLQSRTNSLSFIRGLISAGWQLELRCWYGFRFEFLPKLELQWFSGWCYTSFIAVSALDDACAQQVFAGSATTPWGRQNTPCCPPTASWRSQHQARLTTWRHRLLLRIVSSFAEFLHMECCLLKLVSGQSHLSHLSMPWRTVNCTEVRCSSVREQFLVATACNCCFSFVRSHSWQCVILPSQRAYLLWQASRTQRCVNNRCHARVCANPTDLHGREATGFPHTKIRHHSDIYSWEDWDSVRHEILVLTSEDLDHLRMNCVITESFSLPFPMWATLNELAIEPTRVSFMHETSMLHYLNRWDKRMATTWSEGISSHQRTATRWARCCADCPLSELSQERRRTDPSV